MSNVTSAGVIECGINNETTIKDRIGNTNGLVLKKMLVKNKTSIAATQQLYPMAELVDNTASIIQDDTIQLVLVADPQEQDKDLISQVMQSGKHVRII
jgi:predicted dehydrogenase